jgi:uncharacterized RDD family membrane protein YckC
MAEIETVPVPEGARCAQHPDLAAVALCSRCGSYSCQACTRGRAGRAYCAQCAELLPHLAGQGSRLLAAILDTLLIGGPVWLAMVAGAFFDTNAAASEDSDGSSPGPRFWLGMIFGGFAALAVGGVNLMLAYKHGQTIAKRWLGLRVVRSDGSRADLPRIVFLRNLLPGVIGAVPFIGSIFQLADSLFIFRADRRCIHDHIADTIVVQLPKDR